MSHVRHCFSCMFQMIQNKYFKCPYFFRDTKQNNTCRVPIFSEIQNKYLQCPYLFRDLPLRNLESDLNELMDSKTDVKMQLFWQILMAVITWPVAGKSKYKIQINQYQEYWVDECTILFFSFRVHIGESCRLMVLRELAFWKQILLKRAKQKLKIKGFVLNLVLTMDKWPSSPLSLILGTVVPACMAVGPKKQIHKHYFLK